MHRQSFLRYVAMASTTLVLTMVILWTLVDFANLAPMFAAALAIVSTFILRYVIAKRWIWRKSTQH